MDYVEADGMLRRLQHDYPKKEWKLRTFNVEGKVRYAIVFVHTGTEYHDPFASSCGRFDRKDRYGLSDVDARWVRRVNREFERNELGIRPDLEFVYKTVVDLIQKQAPGNPLLILDDLGFAPVHTGGGVMPLGIYAKDGSHVLVIDRAGSAAPETMADAWVGRYDPSGSEVESFSMNDHG